MMTTIRMFKTGLLFLALGIIGCGQPASDDSDQTTTSGIVVTEFSADTTGNLVLEADIPVAGRYRVAVRAKHSGTDTGLLWLEDYINNPDNRTYDITGPMEVAAGDDWTEVTRDGSPLNAGLHRMRVHISDTTLQVDQVAFELLRPHRLTPDTLVQETSGKEWTLAWSDEFDGSGAVDTSKWTYDIGNWGWGNKELQYYTVNRMENARREEGVLVIEARKNDEGLPWTSARLTTRGKVTFLYGRIEIRAKVPTGRGTWAAGWTLGDAYVDEFSWPYCGEIDILESVGYEMDAATGNGQAHATIHCGAYYFKLGNQPSSSLPVERMHQEFHTYALEWTPEGIKAFVDDQLYFEYTDTVTPLAWPFDQPQNLILNLAMGGGWGGAMGMDETLEKEQYLVDYVRVYARKS